MRGLWEGDCLTEHRHPLARPLGMPSGHIAHASLRGDTQIHYYLVRISPLIIIKLFLIDRSVIWVHSTYHPSLTWEEFVLLMFLLCTGWWFSSRCSVAWLARDYREQKVSDNTVEKEVFFINTGKTKGTTFKIKVKDLVFSSLFNTGAQVSCIKYDTIMEMGLLHQIADSSTCIRTANGQDVGVRGSVMISFKIGLCSFTHKFVVCNGITRTLHLRWRFPESSLFQTRMDRQQQKIHGVQG